MNDTTRSQYLSSDGKGYSRCFFCFFFNCLFTLAEMDGTCFWVIWMRGCKATKTEMDIDRRKYLFSFFVLCLLYLYICYTRFSDSFFLVQFSGWWGV